MRLAALLLLASPLVLGCSSGANTPAKSPPPPQAGELAPGDYDIELGPGRAQRYYLVHVPAQARAGKPLPVVLNFHGGGGTPEGQRDWSGMDAVADRAGFVVVYPAGTPPKPGVRRLLTWNAGRCCGPAHEQDVDDIAFVRAVLADLSTRVAVDRTRVYATGLSNGAMMAYWLALRAPRLVAAIAPVSGTTPFTPAADSPAVAVMHIHSVDDPRALYRGGFGPPFPMTTTRIHHSPVEQVVHRWVRHNGCPAKPRVDPSLRGKPGGPDEGKTATRLTWAPCTRGYSVVLWRLTGSGHVWPGAPHRFSERLLGPATQVLSADEAMWAFFRRFSRPDAAPLVGAGATGRGGVRPVRTRVVRLEDMPDADLDIPFDRSRIALGVGRATPGLDAHGRDHYGDVGFNLRAGISLYSHLKVGIEHVSGLRVMAHARFGGLRAEMLGLEPKLYRAGLGASVIYLSQAHNLYALYAGASVAEEIGLSGRPSLRPAVLGLGTQRFGEDFSLLYGGGVVYVLSKPFPVPLLGLTWRMADDWRLSLLLPVGLSLRWQLSEKFRLGALVSVSGEYYRVANDGIVPGGPENVFVGVTKFRAGLRGTYRASDYWSLHADLGVEGRRLRTSDGADATDAWLAKPGGYLGASVAYAFGSAPF